MTISKQVMNLLNEIDEKNKRLIELEEARLPFVSIFYIIDKELYWEGYPFSEVKSQNGIRNYPREHSQYWKYSILKIRPELKQFDYKEFPRGRVLYNDETRKPEIYCDKCVKNDNKIKYQINDEMNLPYTTQYFTDGLHYKCKNCR